MLPSVLPQVSGHAYLRPGFHLSARAAPDAPRPLPPRHRADGRQARCDSTTPRAARGLLDDTLLVVTSDHGEAFGEHGLYFHDASVYETHLHVPLWIHHPDRAPRRGRRRREHARSLRADPRRRLGSDSARNAARPRPAARATGRARRALPLPAHRRPARPLHAEPHRRGGRDAQGHRPARRAGALRSRRRPAGDGAGRRDASPTSRPPAGATVIRRRRSPPRSRTCDARPLSRTEPGGLCSLEGAGRAPLRTGLRLWAPWPRAVRVDKQRNIIARAGAGPPTRLSRCPLRSFVRCGGRETDNG